MKRTLKGVLVIGLVALPVAWLFSLTTKIDPYEEEFRDYIERNFERLKSEEQKWIH